ncbi:DUF547 domain-containing protein [Kordiimonas sp.]|uniref:DUF547 domain-containing protein n=1 Tax=Kordiimonas sp. TaxID=1970157 RepID=UPI003A930B61
MTKNDMTVQVLKAARCGAIFVMLAVSGFVVLASGASAGEDVVPEPFRPHAKVASVEIKYDDWTYILHSTVFDAGRSDRRAAPTPKPQLGRLTVKVNTSSTRLEGNRLHFPAFDDDNLEALTRIRREFEALPGAVPMAEWSRNQQLAYWLNLHNITVVEQLAQRYPERHLRKVMKKLRKKKLLRVAGVKLSLDDIHHDILIAKWQDPLVMYGLWQGYVGGPNIRREAYTADNVYQLLKENAVEFINSNRGVKVKNGTLQVAAYYRENSALFPGGEPEFRDHLAAYADLYFAGRIQRADEIRMTTSDYYIADLFEGVPVDINPNAVNPAALQTAGNGPEWSNFAASAGGREWANVPPHVMSYVMDIRRKLAKRKSRVSVEEVDRGEVPPGEDAPQ